MAILLQSAPKATNNQGNTPGKLNIPTPPPTPNISQDTASIQKASADKVVGSISQGGAKMANTPSAVPYSKTPVAIAAGQEIKKTGALLEGTLGAAAGAINFVSAPLTAALSKAFGGGTSQPSKIPGMDKLSSSLDAWSKQHPEAATNLMDAITVGSTLALGVKSAPIAKTAQEGVEGTISSASEALARKSAMGSAKEFQKLQEMIAPKTSAKTLLQEGRVVSGKDPTLLSKGTVDSVIPSADSSRVAHTISDNIPGWNKLKAPELENAMYDKVSTISKQLSPELQKVPVTKQMVAKINDSWTALKKTQIADAPADLEANVAKRQVKFEAFLQKARSGNVDDLWNATKDYDASIKSNVKKATDQSAPDVFQQHEEWLQNRRILTDITHDAETTLPTATQKLFATMRDMYSGMQGIESDFKLTTEPAPSKIAPYVKGAIGAGSLYEGGRKILTGSF